MSCDPVVPPNMARACSFADPVPHSSCSLPVLRRCSSLRIFLAMESRSPTATRWCIMLLQGAVTESLSCMATSNLGSLSESAAGHFLMGVQWPLAPSRVSQGRIYGDHLSAARPRPGPLCPWRPHVVHDLPKQSHSAVHARGPVCIRRELGRPRCQGFVSTRTKRPGCAYAPSFALRRGRVSPSGCFLFGRGQAGVECGTVYGVRSVGRRLAGNPGRGGGSNA